MLLQSKRKTPLQLDRAFDASVVQDLLPPYL
jgi:hypothetical protein